MYKIRIPEYEQMLRNCYSVRQPLFICGGPGIGKSALPRQVFKQIAQDEGKIFYEWSDLNLVQKAECIAHPEKYWIFADMRTSQMDTTSLVGIPNMANTEMLENIPYSWVIYFTQPTAHGCIFFDEINLSAPIVQSITYSAIHDRVISDRRLSEHVYVFAAGNRSQDKAHTFDMPLPLRDRFAEAEVGIDLDAWVDWASRSGLNTHLTAFIKWKPANLYNADTVKAEKPATPRGIERASRLLRDMKIEDFEDNTNSNPNQDKIHMLVSISCGESFATEFQAYCKVYRQLDWPAIIANPSSVGNMSLDKQYAISAGIADQFKRTQDSALRNKLLDVADCLRQDFGTFSYRMMMGEDRDKFKALMVKMNRAACFAKKYGKFLLDMV
jgi:MoxR-like ATPase